MKQAGAIIRVSTARQLDGTSPDKQLEAILDLSNKHGFEISPNHIWQTAESGSLRGEAREGFQSALAASKANAIERVYVFSLDRLGRDLLEMLMFLRDLKDCGVECWAADQRQQMHHDDLVVMILGAVASNERKQILARTQDGMDRSVASGKYCGGIVAYGYTVNQATKRLEINEKEAEVVRNIYQWCIDEKLSCVKIALRLNALNIPTHYSKDNRSIRKGKRSPEKTLGVWREGQVDRILRNRGYHGKWEYGKRSPNKNRQTIPVENYYPAIITEDTYNLAKEVLHRNTLFSDRNAHKQYLLRGLIFCGLCGLRYYGRCSTYKQVDTTYYVCGGRSAYLNLIKPTQCLNARLRGDQIEAVVWEDVKAFCKTPEVVLEHLRENRKPLDDTLAVRLEESQRRMEELKRKEKNLLKIAADSEQVDMQTLDSLLSENHQSQATLRKYNETLQASKAQAHTLEEELADAAKRLHDLSDRIDSATYEEKRHAIETLVKSIVVVPREMNGKSVPEVTITYRFNEPCINIPDFPGMEENSVFASHTAARVDTFKTR